jgi:hypothetical protein
MMFTMTTSKRPALFERTLDSLMKNCRDLYLMDAVLVVDDGSSPDELNMMRQRLETACPDAYVDVITTNPAEGQALRMQAWRDKLEGYFVFHCEDDWEFTVSGCPILAGLDVLVNDQSIGQVALSRDIPSKTPNKTPTGTNYWLWEYDGSANYTDGVWKSWPGYTTNPSIVRVSAIRTVGLTKNIPGFEHEYGLRWSAAGYKTAYLMPQFCQHIGDKVSAFDINGTTR